MLICGMFHRKLNPIFTIDYVFTDQWRKNLASKIKLFCCSDDIMPKRFSKLFFTRKCLWWVDWSLVWTKIGYFIIKPAIRWVSSTKFVCLLRTLVLSVCAYSCELIGEILNVWQQQCNSNSSIDWHRGCLDSHCESHELNFLWTKNKFCSSLISMFQTWFQ